MRFLDEGLQPAFDFGPDSRYGRSSSRGATFTKTPPIHADLPDPAGGALERRSPRHGAGLHLHAPGDRRASPPDFQGPHRRDSIASAVDAKTVRVVLRSRYAGWHDLFQRHPAAHALAGQDLTRIWRDRIDESRRRARRSGTARSSSSGSGAGSSSSPQPPLLGTAHGLPRPARHPLLPGLPAAANSLRRRSRVSGRATSPMTFPRDTELIPDLRRIRGVSVRPISDRTVCELPPSPLRPPAGIRRSRSSSSARRSPTQSIGQRSCTEPWAISTRPIRRSTARSSGTRIAPTVPTGTSTAIARLLPAAFSSGPDAGAEPTASTSCAGERLSLRLGAISGVPYRARIARADRAVPSADRYRGNAQLRTPYRLLDQLSSISGDFDIVAFAWIGRQRLTTKDLWLRWRAERSPGYCQRLVTADLEPGRPDTR